MANTYVNKVIINNVVKIDLTSDTVTAAKLLKGYTAHDKTGKKITGTFDMDEYLSTNFRGLYRGKSLGTGTTFAAASTAAQKSAIADGTFKNLFVGDYWTIGGVKYRIADFDYWLNTGQDNNSLVTTHHLVIVPDTSLYSGYMNSTNTSVGGYHNSYMLTNSASALNKSITTIQTAFGSYLLQHKDYLEYLNDSGVISGGWKDRTVDLLSEIALFGNRLQSRQISDTDHRYLTTLVRTQLQLFRVNPSLIPIKTNYWLRDISNTTEFVRVNPTGFPTGAAASSSIATRVMFAVRGTTS